MKKTTTIIASLLFALGLSAQVNPLSVSKHLDKANNNKVIRSGNEVFSNLTNPKDPKYSGLRTFAKDLTAERRRLYQNGRLGMIIDGTGDDFKKISGEKISDPFTDPLAQAEAVISLFLKAF